MKNVALIVLFAALTGLVVWIAMGGLAPQTEVVKDNLDNKQVLRTEKDFVAKLTELKMRRDRVKNSIKRIENLQAKNLQHLKDKGINRVADAKDDPDALIALNNVKEWKLMIEKRKADIEHLNGAISRLDGMLSKFKRENLEKSVGLSEEQVIDLMAIQIELDEKLGIDEDDPLQDMELDEMLESYKNQ